MRKLLNYLMLAAVMLLAVPQHANAEASDVMRNKLNFTCIPKGNGVYTIKVPVYVGGRGGNIWAPWKSDNKIKVTAKDKENSEEFTILYFTSSNFENKSSGSAEVKVWTGLADSGLFTFALYGGGVKELTNASKEIINCSYSKDITNEHNTVFLEFDWKADYDKFNGKELKFDYEATFSSILGSPKPWQYPLGQYLYTSKLVPPTIAGSYLNINALEGEEGKVKLFGYSATTPKQIDLLINDKLVLTTKNCDNNSIELLLDKADTTRCAVLRAYYNDDGTTTTLDSKPLTILPYHSIQNVKIKEKHSPTPQVSSGHKEITWEIDTRTQNDMYPSDNFVIERSYYNDMSDAVVVGTVSLSDSLPLGKYTFIDSISGYTTNQYDTYKDRDYYSQNFYSVRRSTAKAFFSSVKNDYSRIDSVYNTVGKLPKVTGVEIKKDSNFERNGKITVQAILDLDHNNVVKRKDENGGFEYYAAKWNDAADIKLKVIRLDGQRKLLSEDILTFDKSGLKYNPEGYYYVDEKFTINEHGINFKFQAFVEIPEEAPYLHFATTSGYSEDSGATSEEISCTPVAAVYNVKASQGTEYGKIRVQWDLPSVKVDGMAIYRLKEGDKVSTADRSWGLENNATFFEDTKADPNTKYRYVIRTYVYYGDKKVEYYSSDYEEPAIGWTTNIGKISGKVITSNNTAIGGLTVELSTNSGVAETTTTKDDGTFEFNNAVFGYYYTVKVSADPLVFTYNGKQQAASSIILDASNAVLEGLTFVCTNTERFSGRVLFENSTVPVSGANFLVNGKMLYDSDGRPVTSDHNGNFEFYVPSHKVSVQVFKKGHHFVNNGFIIGKENGDNEFVPSSAYDGLFLYDQTKVLLRGRVIGGNTLAAKPLGQGLTQNNLGNDITLQLKLEGNNTASIVYLKDEPEKDTLIVFNEQKWLGKTVTNTRTDFFRKHFNIHVDNRTGEYAVEVFPTKYKVSQAYAQGYASLFTHGETAQVIDLTDSVTTDPDRMATATYSLTYHSDVDITYKQLLWGQSEVNYLGAKEIPVSSLVTGKAITTPLVYDEDKETCSYMLGAPLFLTGERYFLCGYAHEDYYFNNEPMGDHFVEPIREGVVTIENGLTSSNPESKEYTLNKEGQFIFDFVANNDNFSQSGEDAMRQLNSSLLMNGYYYQSKPISAYVTGQRLKEGDIFTAKNAYIDLLDILRDPPGGAGTAYLGEGKTYEMKRVLNWGGDLNLDINFKKGTNYTATVGTFAGEGGGTYTGTVSTGETNWETSINIPIFSYYFNREVQYNFTSKRKISTSDNPKDVGAMADVYIGTTTDLISSTRQTICLIDDETYTMSKPSIDAGLIKVIKEGKDSKGLPYYLVTAEQLDFTTSIPSMFVYSQSHILTKIIPQLVSARSALLYGGEGVTKEDVKNLAKEQNKTLYYYEDADEEHPYGIKYEPVYPGDKQPEMFVNEVEEYSKQIASWLAMIEKNEYQKILAMRNVKDSLNTYSLSAGQKIEHSEEIAYAQKYAETDNFSVLGFNVSNFRNDQASNNATKLANSVLQTLLGRYTDKLSPDSKGTAIDRTKFKNSLVSALTEFTKKDSTGIMSTKIQTPVTKFTVEFTPHISIDYTDDREGYPLRTVENGFETKIDDDSYLNFSVVRTPDINYKNFDYIRELAGFANRNDATDDYLHNNIYVVNGGATRNPWMDADSTVVYSPGTPLGVRTQKIDNPKMIITNPEVSNVPESEKAVFQLKLTNDSEWTGNQATQHPSIFNLSLIDSSNDKGAKISIDGVPLSDGRKIYIDPGQTITKTMEVARGAGYDFNDMKLFLCCESDENNCCIASFSAHFLPSSSPVKISAPTDKWVMNTYSASDEHGFYLPVVIEGYDVNYNNFDHLEIQYKKSTEGESGWVNLCSYYVDDDLYERASGTKSKEQILSGRITHPFYGEKDPIEMKYDIRAVTFCRLGTGYVTCSSNIISGTKDTRRPTIFGQTEPLNGILTSGSNIVLPFSEAIAYNYLDETSNFDVRGYTNSTKIDTNVGLTFTGDNSQDAYTTVSRNLMERDFTIDMLVQPAKDKAEMTFFSHGTPEEGDLFEFGITSDNKLFANVNGTIIKSQALAESINLAMNHVGVAFKKLDGKDNEGKYEARFFWGSNFLKNDSKSPASCDIYYGNSPIHFGVSRATTNPTKPFEGRMLETRLWSQAIGEDMVSLYNHKQLDGFSNRIIAYWPMRQSNGEARDYINGADLTLKNVHWHTVAGHSLYINNQSLTLDGLSVQRSANLDYTLTFWAKFDEAADKSYIFSAGDDHVAEEGYGKMRIGFEDGNFMLRSNGHTYALCSSDKVVNQQWHNFAFSVSKSKNLAHIYLDGNLVQQVQGDKVDGITNGEVKLGSKGMKANVDLFTVWNHALPQNYLDYIRGNRLTGDEMGLDIYLPFDEAAENIQGSAINQFTVTNQATDNKSIYHKAIVTDSKEANISNQNAPVIDNIPLARLKSSWSSDGTRLLINIDMKDSEINHRNIYVTVRDVEDLNGNPMANPHTWVIYTDRNILKWNDQTPYLTVKQGDSVTKELTWSNTVSTSVNYTISTSSPFITLSSEMGVIEPASTNRITYTVQKGMSPGDYVEYIWLRDEDNDMTSTLPLHITVEGEAPDWTVDRSKYDQTMTIIANVKQKAAGGEIFDTDTRDIVAAFVGAECVGVANISTNSSGLSQLYLNVYGNSETEGENLSFYLWDFTEGAIFQLVTDDAVSFKANTSIGMPPSDPLTLRCSESEMQDVVLKAGWNWVALNVMPYNTSSANTVFINNHVFSDGDIIKDDANHSEYSRSKKLWQLDDIVFSPKKVYHVYVTKAVRASILGTELKNADQELDVKQGWNEIPYSLTYSQNISQAMRDFQINDKASEGDIVKGIESFAVLSKDYGWIGSLQMLEAGQGYYLYHTGKDATFSFNKNGSTPSVANAEAQSSRMVANGENAMPVIAAMAEGEELTDEAEIEVYSGAALVSKARSVVLPDGRKLYFAMVSQSDANVHFVVSQPDEDPYCVGALPYSGTTCIGSLQSPYILSAKNIFGDTDEIYDLGGRRVDNTKQQGIYVKKGAKVRIK